MIDIVKIMNPIPQDRMKIVAKSVAVDFEMYMAADDEHEITTFSPCLLFKQGEGWSGIKMIGTIQTMVTGRWQVVSPPADLDEYGLEYPAQIAYYGSMKQLEELKRSMGW